MLKAEYDYDMDIAVQREEAKEEGREEIILLIQNLLKDNRQEEIAKVSTDADFRNKLLQEYGLGRE